MDCPKCKYYNTLVVDTRNNKDYTVIRRRRECQKCGYKFTTYERIEPEEMKIENKARRTLEKIERILDSDFR